MEPNTKLFPAVFVLPTHQNVIQFELGKQKVGDGARMGRLRNEVRDVRLKCVWQEGSLDVFLEVEWLDPADWES